MSQRIDQFCEDLRLKLTNVESGLSGLKAKIDGKTETAEQEVRNHLDRVRKRIDQGFAKVAATQAEIKNWTEEQKAAMSSKVAEWKTSHEAKKLQNRADRAEWYAAATGEVAVAALDNAEEAASSAWLARQDAKSVQPKA